MGGLLEAVEGLKTPTGMIIFVIVVAAAYLWYRWLFTEPKEPESK
jgi:hypothetical protein